MRDNRYARGGAPFEEAGQEFADGYPQPAYGYGQDGARADEDSVGFTRHRSSNARRLATGNPVVGAVKQAGGTVAGFFQNLGSKAAGSVSSMRAPARGAAPQQDGGDYLGAGDPCRVCGKPVDPAQRRCPHCGAFVRPLYASVPFWIAIVVLVGLVVLLSFAINSCKAGGEEGPGSANVPAATGSRDKNGLTAALTAAQATVDSQAANRTYTRHSLNNLQYHMGIANGVLANPNASEDEIAQAIDAINVATGALVGIVADYPWPEYADLLGNVETYRDQQVAVNGTVQTVTENADGSLSTLIAAAGDANSIIQIDYAATEAPTPIEVGDDVTVYGTVTGAWNNCPVLLADKIEIAA